MNMKNIVIWTLIVYCTAVARAGLTWSKQRASRTLRGVICNKFSPCPKGYTCMFNPYIPGTKTCFYGDIEATRRGGRCPAIAGPNPFPNKCGRCLFNADCGETERCCATADKRMKCVQAEPIDPKPTITPLIVGSVAGAPPDFVFHSACTLVQCNGKNIIVDTGPIGDGPALLKAVAKAGLQPGDIDLVFTTHGHPDHYSNDVFFTDSQNHFYGFMIDGPNYSANPDLGGTANGILFDDTNLQMIATPGHTPQCTTLIVKNVDGFTLSAFKIHLGKGTVAIAGDAVLTKSDYKTPPTENETYMNSLRAIMCTADWVVPGHDSMFQVTDEMRQAYQCAVVA